jgi:RecA-family ATPase|tara:strand:+ start:614 stop:976 length:363 start_codon:yes stop_codon:yes gene_type:complete
MNKDKFLKTKKTVQRKYPNAKTMMDNSGKYYVATEDGKDICNLLISRTMDSYKFDQTEGAIFGLDNFNATLNKVATIPHSKTVVDAWQQAEIAIKSYHVVDRNNSKFSDEKIMKKVLKDE